MGLLKLPLLEVEDATVEKDLCSHLFRAGLLLQLVEVNTGTNAITAGQGEDSQLKADPPPFLLTAVPLKILMKPIREGMPTSKALFLVRGPSFLQEALQVQLHLEGASSQRPTIPIDD
jgi:hypothetical protein